MYLYLKKSPHSFINEGNTSQVVSNIMRILELK